MNKQIDFDIYQREDRIENNKRVQDETLLLVSKMLDHIKNEVENRIRVEAKDERHEFSEFDKGFLLGIDSCIEALNEIKKFNK